MALGALLVFGLIILSSASHSMTGNPYYYLSKQLIWIVAGIVITILIALYLDYTHLSHYSLVIYVATIVLLLVVLIFGKEVRGSTGWIGVGFLTFQPGELAKIMIVLSFAEFLKNRVDYLNTFWEMLPCFLYMGLPFLLVAVQPNIGTALAFVAITLGMMFVAGANPRILGSIVITCIILTVLAVFLHQHYGLWLPLKDYQLQRLLVFTNPYNDGMGGMGNGWNTIQALIAVGSGGFTGKGLFHGPQVQLNFLPEQHTDFIFAVVGEELGYVGAIVLLVLYAVLIIRAIKIAEEAEDLFSTLVSIGLVSIWVYHIFQSIGMCIGIMPITGIPLPFVSYGGSFMLSNAINIGILITTNLKGRKIVF
jgi:rod shape determining protein RodA